MPNHKLELESTQAEITRLKNINAPAQAIGGLEFRELLLMKQIEHNEKQSQIIAAFGVRNG